MDFKNYDPKEVIVVFRGVQLQGYAEGTFVMVEREVDAYTKSTGAAGDVTRVRSRNKSGSITVTLQAASPANDLLSAIARDDELYNTGYGSALVKNLNGTTYAQSDNAWIRKLPNTEYADSASSREWVFDCADLDMFVGGALS